MAPTTTSKAGSKARRLLLSLTVAAVALLLSSAVALADVRIGTNGSETIVGTHSSDLIDGNGGNDTLKGLAGNDTYLFAEAFGTDTIEENATYKVGKKKLAGGTDTLSFARFNAFVNARLVPAWSDQGWNRVVGGSLGNATIELGASRVENIVGGIGFDTLEGGAGTNTYSGGSGGSDDLKDWGGWEGNSQYVAQPVSNDTYRGFASGAGQDEVYDYAGTADRLDLRPLESSDVHLETLDHDGKATNGNESLRIVINDSTAVTVVGHFVPAVEDYTWNGRMEQIVFTNETVSGAAEVRALMQ